MKEAAGGPLAVALIDADAARHAPALAAAGVDEVLTVPRPEPSRRTVRARAGGADRGAGSRRWCWSGTRSTRWASRRPSRPRSGLGFASDVVALDWDGGPVARRGAYGDKLLDELEFPGKACTLLMLRPGTFAPAVVGAARPPGGAPFDAGELPGAARTEHVGFREAPAGDVDITKADFLLSIGRGVAEQDNIPRFEELARRLGATLSVSRPIVDAGWMPSARQVGQSGKTVKPRLYLALGISGAVQHLAGMRTAETIIAVNTDPEAPIFGVAHYGAVVDMFELADELEAQLS